MTTLSVLEEFQTVVDSIYGVYLDATRGFQLVRKAIDETQQSTLETLRSSHPELASLEYLEGRAVFYGKGEPTDANAVVLHKCTQAEYKARNELAGNNFKFIANVCVVALYQYWEDYYREKLADSMGVAKNDVVSPVMGDIRYFRQSIIHNRGVAVREVERCSTLKWFTRGEPLFLDPDKFETLILEVKTFIAGMADSLGNHAISSNAI